MSEVNYNDLGSLQKKALTDAFGEPSEYETPLLSEADATEVADYSKLRTKLEGLDVEKGSIDSERLDYFTGENGNILRESDEGEYEINSIWDSWMLEEMEEKDMIDSSQFSFYKADNLENTDISVLEVEGEFYLDIEDGVTFSLGSAETVEGAEYDSAEKVQQMTQDFIKQFACDEDEEPGDTGYMNNISSKPEENSVRINGGENMTEKEEQLQNVLGRLEKLQELAVEENGEYDADEVKNVIGQVSDSISSFGGQLDDLQSDIDDLEDELEGHEEAFENYQEVIEHANGLLLYEEDGEERGIIPELESQIGEMSKDIDDIYGRLDNLYRTARNVSMGEYYGSDWNGLDEATQQGVNDALDNGGQYVDYLQELKQDFEEEFYDRDED